MKKLLIVLTISMCFILTSCNTLTQIGLLCDEDYIEIYIDDEYVGHRLIYYTVPKHCDYINVSCRENGIEVFSKNYFVRGCKNQLFELNIPKNYQYSNKNK